MKKLTLIGALIGIITLTNCGKDDTPGEIGQTLLALERSTGKVHSVDLTDGSKTEVLTVSGAANIRSFVYDEASDVAFVGQSYIGNETAEPYGGRIYKVDMSTGTATLLFDNLVMSSGVRENGGQTETGQFWGVLDLHIDNGQLYGMGYERANSNHSYFKVDMSTGDVSEIVNTETGYPQGGATIVDAGNSTVYYAEYASAESSLRSVNMTSGVETTTSWSTTNAAAFEAVFADFDVTDVNVQNFAMNHDGEIYATVSVQSSVNREDDANGVPVNQYWFLASVNLSTANMEYVATLATEKANQVQAIGFVPSNIVD